MEIQGNGSVTAQELGLQNSAVSFPARGSASQADQASWFEAMARAWAEGLDNESQEIVQLSNEMQSGSGESDAMGNQVEFQAQVQRLSFMSEAAANSIKTGAQAMSSVASRN